MRRRDDQVKVVRHEALRVNLPAGLGARLGQRLQETRPVLVVAEDFLPPVALSLGEQRFRELYRVERLQGF